MLLKEDRDELVGQEKLAVSLRGRFIKKPSVIPAVKDQPALAVACLLTGYVA